MCKHVCFDLPPTGSKRGIPSAKQPVLCLSIGRLGLRGSTLCAGLTTSSRLWCAWGIRLTTSNSFGRSTWSFRLSTSSCFRGTCRFGLTTSNRFGIGLTSRGFLCAGRLGLTLRGSILCRSYSKNITVASATPAGRPTLGSCVLSRSHAKNIAGATARWS